jgi:hypothetical protein
MLALLILATLQLDASTSPSAAMIITSALTTHVSPLLVVATPPSLALQLINAKTLLAHHLVAVC